MFVKHTHTFTNARKHTNKRNQKNHFAVPKPIGFARHSPVLQLPPLPSRQIGCIHSAQQEDCAGADLVIRPSPTVTVS